MVYTQEGLAEALQEKISEIEDWFKEVYPAFILETNTAYDKDVLATRVSFYVGPQDSNKTKYIFYEITEKMRLEHPDIVQGILDTLVEKLQRSLEGTVTNWE